MRKIRLKLLVGVLFFGLALVVIDVSRQPENQLSARIYIGLVHVYQAVGRPMLEGVVACRFRPTCSEYSIQAVERFGIVRGLILTAERLYSCQNSVPMGTPDPIPEA
jgi:putative membrane protein insertion efficiency factor